MSSVAKPNRWVFPWLILFGFVFVSLAIVPTLLYRLHRTTEERDHAIAERNAERGLKNKLLVKHEGWSWSSAHSSLVNPPPPEPPQ